MAVISYFVALLHLDASDVAKSKEVKVDAEKQYSLVEIVVLLRDSGVPFTIEGGEAPPLENISVNASSPRALLKSIEHGLGYRLNIEDGIARFSDPAIDTKAESNPLNKRIDHFQVDSQPSYKVVEGLANISGVRVAEATIQDPAEMRGISVDITGATVREILDEICRKQKAIGWYSSLISLKNGQPAIGVSFLSTKR